jgi:hypothetical protein
MGVQEGWAGLNSYGRLKVILMVELGCKFAFDPVYDEVCEYVEHFNQGGAEAVLNDKRQIARHAMIIKLTRL